MQSNMFMQESWRTNLAGYFEAFTAANVLFFFSIVVLGVSEFAFGHPLSAWVLPAAFLILLLSIGGFSNSWRQAGIVMALFVIAHAAAYMVASYFFDGSWDGLAYHQEAILKIAQGWNPIFQNSPDYGANHEMWNDHFPKGSWIAGAAVFLNGGRIEAGKLFNFTLIIAAASQTAATLLRLTRLRIFPLAAITLLIALNPVVVYQSTTFYVDGLLYDLLIIGLTGLILYLAAPRWSTLLVALFALCLMINLKFTGVVYAGMVLGAAVGAVWYRRGFKAGYLLGLAAAITMIVGALLLGYSPYVRNFREKGHPFYPMYGGQNLPDYTGNQRPANLTNKDRFSRFVISNFSRSDSVHGPRSTQLKLPFSIYSSERSAWSVADVQAGGFGPWFGGLLLVAGGAALVLISNSLQRRNAAFILGIIALLLATMFIHSEAWWARYAPQAWLIPLLMALACWQTQLRLRQQLGWLIIALATINVLFVGYYFVRQEWEYTKATRLCLREMSTLHQPITAYLGPFPSLQERLHETGVDLRTNNGSGPVESANNAHAIPCPDRHAFWTTEAFVKESGPGIQ